MTSTYESFVSVLGAFYLYRIVRDGTIIGTGATQAHADEIIARDKKRRARTPDATALRVIARRHPTSTTELVCG